MCIQKDTVLGVLNLNGEQMYIQKDTLGRDFRSRMTGQSM